MFCKFGFHKYIELGFQNSTFFEWTPKIKINDKITDIRKN